MGVLGWTYDQTLDTPMPAIAAAIGARNKYVNTILKTLGSFIGVEFKDDAPPAPPITPSLFDTIFARAK